MYRPFFQLPAMLFGACIGIFSVALMAHLLQYYELALSLMYGVGLLAIAIIFLIVIGLVAKP